MRTILTRGRYHFGCRSANPAGSYNLTGGDTFRPFLVYTLDTGHDGPGTTR
jgi:hypothetical protein